MRMVVLHPGLTITEERRAPRTLFALVVLRKRAHARWHLAAVHPNPRTSLRPASAYLDTSGLGEQAPQRTTVVAQVHLRILTPRVCLIGAAHLTRDRLQHLT